MFTNAIAVIMLDVIGFERHLEGSEHSDDCSRTSGVKKCAFTFYSGFFTAFQNVPQPFFEAQAAIGKGVPLAIAVLTLVSLHGLQHRKDWLHCLYQSLLQNFGTGVAWELCDRTVVTWPLYVGVTIGHCSRGSKLKFHDLTTLCLYHAQKLVVE